MEKPFTCALCQSSFGHQCYLQRHHRNVHENSTRFHCTKCPKSFGVKSNLVHHASTVHDKLKPYQCSRCAKSFGHRSHLTDHVRTVHDKLKPFQCSICAKSFGVKSHLTAHVRTVHENLKRLSTRSSESNCPPVSEGTIFGSLPHKRIKGKPAVTEDIKEEEEVENLIEENKSPVGPGKTVSLPVVKRIRDETASSGQLLDEPADVTNENGIVQEKAVVSLALKAGGEDAIAPELRLRATVHFKTSTGRLLTANNQPASVTFGDFRKLFCVPPDSRKLIVFKKLDDANGPDSWIVPDDESMRLPLVDGCIIAETCTDF